MKTQQLTANTTRQSFAGLLSVYSKAKARRHFDAVLESILEAQGPNFDVQPRGFEFLPQW